MIRGTQKSGINMFQGRDLMLHPWEAPIYAARMRGRSSFADGVERRSFVLNRLIDFDELRR